MHAVPGWLPNAISCLRILLVPVWVVLAEAANRAGEAADTMAAPRGLAVATLLAIGLSDVVDGFLARRFHLQSTTGATLDAVADKLAQVVLFTYLALRPGPAFSAVPFWFLGLLIARDGLMLAGWLLVRRRAGRVEAEHRAHGKLSSLLLFGLLVAFSAGLEGPGVTALLIAAGAVVIGSTTLYTREGIRQLRAATP